MKEKVKQELKVQVLNAVNDAEGFFIVTDRAHSMGGPHDLIVASLATAIMSNEDIHKVVSEAITEVIELKNSQKTN